MGFNTIIKPKMEITEELFTKICNNVLGNLYVCDKDGNIIFCNESCAETFQCTMEELYSTNVHDLHKKGFTDRISASAEVLNLQSKVVRFIRTGNGVGMLIHGTPVFNENNELEMSVASTFVESAFFEFVDKIDSEKAHLENAIEFLQSARQEEWFLESRNFKMQEVYALALKAAKSDSTISINGESGVGKEIMAHYIHKNSGRSKAIFVPVNCATIPQELMEAELFGYVEGAFTGATKKGKSGLFEVANDGTIFLDEIGEMPFAMQSKLLRVLESGEIRKVGAQTEKKLNVRVIAATNRNLREMVRRGEFREDLFYRLNVIPITIPPLRERPEDVLPLANYFIDKYNKKYKAKKYLTSLTIDHFIRYFWPGNIRELRNVIEQMTVVSNGNELDIRKNFILSDTMAAADYYKRPADGHGAESLSQSEQNETASFRDDIAEGATLKEAVKAFEREYINKVIAQCGGNISAAAKQLGIHRTNLYKTLNRVNM
ncbi:sigma-54 interaction domain-containing protein [Clostridium aminobutyricum]|uniref:Sigma 54-interacting transcriptional regulator n=1 Tax=Clostridium aminobutyricum TaxID=33953 RepID=A0A939DAG2_CLOAM|nr:sigma 54-interacting transcriptional regulator [Clostridium aminobutyricum]MBN7774105.1 sigma 54-interacting transcriptional regulator [Clostridium aminobutyricum]